jgi:hypothetical protein
MGALLMEGIEDEPGRVICRAGRSDDCEGPADRHAVNIRDDPGRTSPEVEEENK